MTPRLEFTGITRSFTTGRDTLPVLDQLSGQVGAGEFVSIVGPSGSGKSSLFSILAGLDRPDFGNVAVNGIEVTGSSSHSAYMPQRDLLLPWRTVLQNAALGLEVQGVPRRQARERARSLFVDFGLAGFENSYPFELSGGMRQRAALLRTVVQESEVILLDEPLGALDSLTRTAMQDWLHTMWQRYRWSVLMVTHDITEAVRLSDRVMVLSERPATVVDTVTVDLPRPRDPLTADFVAIERTIRDALSS